MLPSREARPKPLGHVGAQNDLVSGYKLIIILTDNDNADKESIRYIITLLNCKSK